MNLARVANRWELEVDAELRKQFGKQLWNTTADKKIRLLKLKLWCQRYQVDLQYVLGVLVPYFTKLSARQYYRSQGSRSSSLGVPITMLTGNAAEEFLSKQIDYDFPMGEHTYLFRENRRLECLRKLGEDEETVAVPRGVLQYGSIADFVNSYGNRVARKRVALERLEKKLSKQPFRGNPFL